MVFHSRSSPLIPSTGATVIMTLAQYAATCTDDLTPTRNVFDILQREGCKIIDAPVLPDYPHGNNFEVVGERLTADSAEALDARVEEYVRSFAAHYNATWGDKAVIVIEPPTLRNLRPLDTPPSVEFLCVLAVRKRLPRLRAPKTTRRRLVF